jgi:hypothetical protein
MSMGTTLCSYCLMIFDFALNIHLNNVYKDNNKSIISSGFWFYVEHSHNPSPHIKHHIHTIFNHILLLLGSKIFCAL